jgi:hypothetical protein
MPTPLDMPKRLRARKQVVHTSSTGDDKRNEERRRHLEMLDRMKEIRETGEGLR